MVMAFGTALPPDAHVAHAATVSSLSMPDTVRADGHLLQLNGIALYTRFGMRILVAGLWLDHRESDAEKILRSDAPRLYVTRFLRHVGKKRVCDAWTKGLAANTPDATPEVQEQFRTLCSWTRDFLTGDEITVTYIPGRGSLVEIGGERKGMIPGKGFADA